MASDHMAGSGLMHRADAPAALSEEIGARAYELYLARGAEEGHALDDWLRAEAEIQVLQERQSA